MNARTRKQAIASGAKTYYTGEPCKHGHVEERYTASGACKGCLADSQQGIRRAITEGRATPERLAQLEGLVTIRLRAVPADEATLLDTVAAVTIGRRPLLHAADVVGGRKGVKPEGGTWLYLVHVDAADVQLFRDMQNAMLRARGPNIEAERARIFSGVMAQAEAARDNGETEWKFT